MRGNPWPVSPLPGLRNVCEIDQGPLAHQNNLSQPFYGPPGTITNTMNGLCGKKVALYYCPLDLGIGHDQDNLADTYPRARGNYVLNWGNAMYDNPPPTTGSAPPAGQSLGNGRPDQPGW